MTIMCFGTFDGLHDGHVDYFRQAKALADYLVVVVARDDTAREVKGRSAIKNQDERLMTVAEHPLVDRALLGLPGDKYEIIEQIRPDVMLLGYDQTAFTDQLEEEMNRRGISTTIHRAAPFHPELYKSSLLSSSGESDETRGSIGWIPASAGMTFP
ncbi:MAG: adenylyltransferase/cytidyltransferase family protein [Candidatus Uhrbacteria bacterium]|nr:adenylyltransferase/cytidyltransferase family protein [Candidatus Uhrbacteria bacterium]